MIAVLYYTDFNSDGSYVAQLTSRGNEGQNRPESMQVIPFEMNHDSNFTCKLTTGSLQFNSRSMPTGQPRHFFVEKCLSYKLVAAAAAQREPHCYLPLVELYGPHQRRLPA